MSAGQCVRKLQVPGVIFNNHLSWIDHARHLRVKVLKTEQYMRRISSSIRGPPTWQMRSLFCSNVRPVLFYASAAWYLPDNKRQLEHGLEDARSGSEEMSGGYLGRRQISALRIAPARVAALGLSTVSYGGQSTVHRARHDQLSDHYKNLRAIGDRLIKVFGNRKYRLIASQYPIIKAYAHAARYHPRLLRWSLSRPPTVPNGTTRNTLSPLSYRPRAEVRQGHQSESRQR